MKKTLNLNPRLLKEAKEACGASTYAETIRLGLEALLRDAAYVRLSQRMGSEAASRDVPRRREAPAAKRHVA